MIKTVAPFDFDDPQTQLIEICRNGNARDSLKKSAACFHQSDIDDIPRDPKMAILHVNALGDYEFYSANRNADAFTERGGRFSLESPKQGSAPFVDIAVGNVQTHPTFVTSGRVYRNHVNDDPAKSYGPIYKSAHNDKMKRVELLIGVPVDEFRDDLQKLASGDQLSWSMSARVSHDNCSICGNKAKKASEYCDHIRNMKGQITKKGNVVAMLNDNMTFFDISQVRRPADRIAHTLRKVASVCTDQNVDFFPNALGLRAPRYLFKIGHPKIAEFHTLISKLADIEKEIPSEVEALHVYSIGNGDLPEEQISSMCGCNPNDVLDAAGEKNLMLSLKDLIRLVSGNKPNDEDVQCAEEMLPGMYSRVLDEDRPEDIMPPLVSGYRTPGMLSPELRANLEAASDEIGLSDTAVAKRAMAAAISNKKIGSKTPLRVKKSSIQRAEISRMVDTYASYQLEFLTKVGCCDETMLKRVIMRNYQSGVPNC